MCIASAGNPVLHMPCELLQSNESLRSWASGLQDQGGLRYTTPHLDRYTNDIPATNLGILEKKKKQVLVELFFLVFLIF